MRAPSATLADWRMTNEYEIFPKWRHRYPPGTTHNTEHVFALEVPAPVPVTLNAREHLRFAWLPWREAAAKCFSWSNRAAIEALSATHPIHKDVAVNRLLHPVAHLLARHRHRAVAAAPLVRAARPARSRRSAPAVRHADRVGHRQRAQRPHAGLGCAPRPTMPTPRRPPTPSTREWPRRLRAPRPRPGVEASTSGYSSFQITDKSNLTRWRVAQTLKLEGSDFAALSTLVSQLQADGGLVIDGTQFHVSDASRNKAEEALTQQAIKSWQARAAEAARGFGFDGWRVGNVAIQTGDSMRPQPVMRAMSYESKSAPVAVEAGNSDVTVTVSGDAILEAPRPR